MRRTFLVSLLLLVLVPALSLAAVLNQNVYAPSGPYPSPGSIYDQETFASYTGGALWDCLVMATLAGPSFNAPNVVTDISSGWSQEFGYPHADEINGPPTVSVTYTIHWASEIVDGTSFINAWYSGGTYLGGFISTYGVRTGWNYEPTRRWDPGCPNRITPEPGTWLTLLAGLGVLGIVRFRG